MTVQEIDVDELDTRMAAGAVTVDVRELDEWQEIRVPGVIHIPLGEIQDRFAEIPEADELLLICKAGGRSMKAAEFLHSQGRGVLNVAGGTTAWVKSGRPTESGS